MSKGRLLLIDDDRHVLESMADWLREQGYVVDAAAEYAKGLQLVDKSAYDVVLCDIRLRDGDGFELLEYCRQVAPGSSVILLTGYGTVDTAIDIVTAVDRGQGYGPLTSAQHRRRVSVLTRLDQLGRLAVWYAR